MKKVAFAVLAAVAYSCFGEVGGPAYMKDSYRLTMSVRVPRIYSNTES